jgi:hypothetical protein
MHVAGMIAAKVFDYFCIYFRLCIMNTDLALGDFEDDEADLMLPTEAEIQSILHERNGVGAEQKTVLQRNLQSQPSAWQGDDLDWLRKQLAECKQRREKCVAVDCRNVRMMKEGTFSVFHQMAVDGIKIYLLNPTEAVQRWHWFKMFAEDCGGNCFRLNAEAIVDYSSVGLAGIFRGPEDTDD